MGKLKQNTKSDEYQNNHQLRHNQNRIQLNGLNVKLQSKYTPDRLEGQEWKVTDIEHTN